jgi:hypothetical protein
VQVRLGELGAVDDVDCREGMMTLHRILQQTATGLPLSEHNLGLLAGSLLRCAIHQAGHVRISRDLEKREGTEEKN